MIWGRHWWRFRAAVDSTLLLAVVIRELGADNALAVTAISESLPEEDLNEARNLAEMIGSPWLTIETSELDDPRYRENSRDRCYYCKHELFTRLVEIVEERGLNIVLDGANADDVGDWRPGHRAGRELGVRSPLKEAGLTKADIRELSREFGLPTAEKPAAACLASRIPYGTEVTAEALRTIGNGGECTEDVRVPRIACPTSRLGGAPGAWRGGTAPYERCEPGGEDYRGGAFRGI